MGKFHLEVADIFCKYGEDYRNKHSSTMLPDQYRVMRAIEICRTATLGGHVDECDNCNHQVISYNSCRNRHCPKCQSLAKAKWLEARRAEILPVEYYHIVFTLPDDLLVPIALQNKKVIYDILFQSASQTLLAIAADPKHLGAKIGFLAILHTWGQTLLAHPHLHCVVPGGGLSKDEKKWVPSRPRFFLSVRVLSRLYRNIFLNSLKDAFDEGKLKFYGRLEYLVTPKAFNNLLHSCRKTEWVVYSKPPFGGPEKVLDYLARYTHRIAISNHRLQNMENGKVTFTYKDYKHGHAEKTMTLDAEEFIRRFLIHVLPNRYIRIRYYGLMANCHRAKKLALCRKLLNVPEDTDKDTSAKQDWSDLLSSLTGKDPLVCPKCQKGRLVCIKTIPHISMAQTFKTRAPPGINSL